MQFVPQEILNEILEYLPLKERILSRRVCRKWRDITPCFAIENPVLLKENLFELIGMFILSSLCPPIYGYALHNSYINIYDFEIRDGSKIITKVRMTSHADHDLRRKIFEDWEYLFTKMDYIDGIPLSRKLIKAFSNIRDLIKITQMDPERKLYYGSQVIFDNQFNLYKIFFDPMWITNQTLKTFNYLTEDKDYDWFCSHWNDNHHSIHDCLKDVFSKSRKLGLGVSETKRSEELAKMIWRYLF